MRAAGLLGVLAVVTALPPLKAAVAQAPSQSARVRVSGAIEALDGDRLTVDQGGGLKETVALAQGAQVYGVERRRLEDVKPGDFIASGGVRGSDGRIHATEVRIFPEALRGTGDGQRTWSARPDGIMTNATVGSVTRTIDGDVLHVAYTGGESELVVGPDVPILAYVPADRGLLKPGAAVVMVALKQPDGRLVANRVTTEKDGVKPPP